MDLLRRPIDLVGDNGFALFNGIHLEDLFKVEEVNGQKANHTASLTGGYSQVIVEHKLYGLNILSLLFYREGSPVRQHRNCNRIESQQGYIVDNNR